MSQAKLEDSNVANIGSEEDIAARVEAAKTEEEWIGAGSSEGVEVWRVEKFHIKKWPKNRYATFLDGDSFIVLDTKKSGDKFTYDVYFWLGKESSQDEKGVAAYKTVELDDLLGRTPVQHREIMGHESDRFLGIFKPKSVQVLKGGIASGFKDVTPNDKDFKPRLFIVKGKKNIRALQVDVSSDSLNDGDVFVLDTGKTVYIWNGKNSSKMEQWKGAAFKTTLELDRNTSLNEVKLHQDENDAEAEAEEFWSILGGKPETIAAADSVPDDKAFESTGKSVLMKLSDSSGEMVFEKVEESTGKLSLSNLKSDDVFICDVGNQVYIWVGKNASSSEKKFAMAKVNVYLATNNRPMEIPVERNVEGVESELFLSYFQ